jgi:hypothetical protein
MWLQVNRLAHILAHHNVLWLTLQYVREKIVPIALAKRLSEFRVLIEFANLGVGRGHPTQKEWDGFERRHPWFTLPILLNKGATERDLLDFVRTLSKNLGSVLDEGDWLREFFRLGGTWTSLKWLLGLQPGPVASPSSDLVVERDIRSGEMRVHRPAGEEDRNLGFMLPADFTPVWSTGRFEYRAKAEFHRVLYALWRESWRARRCPQCSRYFVAATPKQKCCSQACRNLQRSLKNAQYWAENKDEINAGRRKGESDVDSEKEKVGVHGLHFGRREVSGSLEDKARKADSLLR